MGFLIPSALAFAVLALPIIIFYMLKLRRQPAPISSLMLWQQVLQDRQANTPWQRLRRNLLLLLQLLILALLVMALARPYFNVEARVQGNVVILLDASASMQATDIAPSRYAAAQAAAGDLIDRLEAEAAVTVIIVDSSPQVLASAGADHSTLHQALNASRPGNGPADWEAALTLGAANASTLPDSTIVIISDGGLGADGLSEPASPATATGDSTFVMPNLSAPIEFIQIGTGAENQGLVALALRDGPNGPELFVQIANAAPEPARRLVEINVDGRLFDARQMDVPARGRAGLTLTGLPLDTQRVQASLTGSDALAADDVAWAVRRAAPVRVLLVGEGNLFLERALGLLPNIIAQRAAPDQPLPGSPFDLVIFDRTLPTTDDSSNTLPEGNLLFIAPPASTSLFEVSGTFSQTRPSRLEAQHPLLAYVSLTNLHLAQAQAVKPPPWAQTIINAEGGPLLLAGQVDSRRVAIVTFDLHQSDLPLQIDFPILVVNLTRWLVPGQNLEQGQTLRAGQPFALPPAATAGELIIQTPAEAQISLPSDRTTFNDTGELGLYQVLASELDRTRLLTEFAVNLLAEPETDIRPRPIDFTGPTTTENTQTETGRWEWWWGLVLLGLIVLLVEWWVYWRGAVR
jgi:hypothetical protein